jgi:hypothetical protein
MMKIIGAMISPCRPCLNRCGRRLFGKGYQVMRETATPYTLHPTPYTLHPTPYTLKSQPLRPPLVWKGSSPSSKMYVCIYMYVYIYIYIGIRIYPLGTDKGFTL